MQTFIIDTEMDDFQQLKNLLDRKIARCKQEKKQHQLSTKHIYDDDGDLVKIEYGYGFPIDEGKKDWRL